MGMTTCWRKAYELAARGDLPWEELEGRSFLVTGATGLIGSQLVRTILARSEACGGEMTVIAPVRDVGRASRLFCGHDGIRLRGWDASEPLPLDGRTDYVVHAASPTSSRDFAYRPIEVIESILNAAQSVLAHCERHACAKALLLSTMEVYGAAVGPVSEGGGGCLDTMVPRASYPEAKRLAECLFASYASERGVPACVARLTQTFGEGVSPRDARVFAEFARQAVAGEDIVLLTDGGKRSQYVSLDDAVRAMLTLLVRGDGGRAYNVSNPATACSIREMAEMVSAEFGGGGCRVTYGVDHERARTFRQGEEVSLDVSRMASLGWEPEQGLREMYRLMVESWGDRDE